MAVVPHARAGRVRWRTGLVFGLAGMAGAYARRPARRVHPGRSPAHRVRADDARHRRRDDPGPPRANSASRHRTGCPVLRVVVDGVVVGLVTGLVGAGGGFLVVPALALLGGLPMPVAVGTSLLVIAMKSFAGLAGYLSSVSITGASPPPSPPPPSSAAWSAAGSPAASRRGAA